MDSSIRRGPGSIVFRKFFLQKRFRSGLCIELEEYRPSELGSIIFRSKGPDLRKKLGGTYKRENFRIWKKDVLVNNLGTTEHIELILVPIDQKLAELTDRVRNFSKR